MKGELVPNPRAVRNEIRIESDDDARVVERRRGGSILLAPMTPTQSLDFSPRNG